MTATTRSKYVELSEHTPLQIIFYGLLSLLCAVSLLVFVAAPSMELFFASFLRSEVVRDGTPVIYRFAENRPEEIITTGDFGTWALVEARDSSRIAMMPPSMRSHELRRAEYIFKPLFALAPLLVVGGFTLAALITTVLSGGAGLVRQKIEREILNVLDRLAVSQFGEHTPEEIRQLTRDILQADTRRLHDMADIYGMPFDAIDLLQRALRWREASGVSKLSKVHDAIKFYMREYFTDRYSNAVLGMVYIGAAILIIVIGLRGLKFLPATDPSLVLGALGLEFMLLITYAVVLMYGKSEDAAPMLPVHQGSGGIGGLTTDADTEHLLRAFLGTQRGERP